MALAGYALPFGLRQVRLIPLNADGTPNYALQQALPASRTFSFSETEDFEELQGDDHTVASHGAGPVAEWELEGGGISLEVWKILSGGTISSSGTTPNVIKKFTKKTTDSRPYFQVEGRAISDSGGDFKMVVYRCKADGDLEASMENGSFLLTAASGKGYGDLSTDELYDFLHRETAEAFDTRVPTLLTISGGSTVGVGAELNLIATVTYDDASTAVVTGSCIWGTSDPTKATVLNGVVEGVAAGSPTISATFMGISDTQAVTVS